MARSVGGLGGLEVGAGDAVVPAEGILIKEAPEIAESGGEEGEERCQDAPLAEASSDGEAIKTGDSQAGRAKARGGAGEDDESELVGHPENDGENSGGGGKQRNRTANGVEAEEDGGERGQRGGDDDGIDRGGQQPARDRSSGGCGIGECTVRGLRLGGINQNASESGRRRDDFRGFEDARAIEDGVGQSTRLEDGNGGGARELDDVCGKFGRGVTESELRLGIAGEGGWGKLVGWRAGVERGVGTGRKIGRGGAGGTGPVFRRIERQHERRIARRARLAAGTVTGEAGGNFDAPCFVIGLGCGKHREIGRFLELSGRRRGIYRTKLGGNQGFVERLGIQESGHGANRGADGSGERAEPERGRARNAETIFLAGLPGLVLPRSARAC